MTETQVQIIHAAIDCFSEKGIEKTTYRNIAEVVSRKRQIYISRQAVQYHFSTKDAIAIQILAMMDGFISERMLPIESIYNDANNIEMRLKKLFLAFSLEGNATYNKILRILSFDQLSNKKMRTYFFNGYLDKFEDYLKTSFEFLINRGEIMPFDIEPVSRFLICRFLTHVSLAIPPGGQTNCGYVQFTADCEFIIKMILAGNIASSE